MNSRASATDRVFWTDTDDEVARRRYRELVDTIDEGVYHLDPDGQFVAVNDAFVTTTGYSRGDLLGEHVSLLHSPDDLVRLERAINRQRDSIDAVPVELSVQTASGGTIPCVVRVSPLLNESDFQGTLGIVDRKAETQGAPDGLSRAPDEVLRTIIDETGGAAFVLDDTFEIVWADTTVGRYFGIDSNTLVGRDKRQVVHELKRAVDDPDQFAKRVLATYDDNSYVEEFECHVTAGDGREERWLEHWSKPITSGQYAGGRIECYTDVTDQKQSADALKETEEQFNSLVDAVTEYAIFRLDPDGIITSWNEGARTIKGYEREEILGEHISTFYTAEDRAADVPEQNLERATSEGSTEDEGWRVRQDGSRFWANVTITAIRDEDGTHRGYLKVTRDMTERRENEQQLKEQAERHERQRDELDRELDDIFNRVDEAFLMLDSDWKITYVNDHTAELVRIPAEELVGSRVWDVLPEVADGRPRELAEAAMRRQESVDFEFYSELLDVWVEIRGYPDGSGMSVYFRDITERKESEQELQRVRERMEFALNATDAVVWDWNVDDDQASFYPSAESLYGTSIEHWEDFIEVIHPEDRQSVQEGIEQAIETGESKHEEVRIVRDGDVRWIEAPGHPVPADDGPTRMIGVARDITERKTYEHKLKESNERLEQFAYAASHDLQEPLRMVSSYLQLIERRYGDTLDEDGREFLEFAVDGADRMRDMIDGLLTYSRIESEGASFEAVELDEVLEEVRDSLQMKCEECDADISAAPLPRVEGDRGQLRQLFQNLLDNAMTYSGDAPPRIQISAERDGRRWILSVRDEGVGIDPDDADRIFEVFQSLDGPDDQGSGIGLALCKRIVERHGGDIWVDSRPGEGATFSFTLPGAGADDE